MLNPFKGVLEQIMPSFITPTKIGIRHTRIAFSHTLIKKPSELGYNNPIFMVQKCTQMSSKVYEMQNAFFAYIYMIATPVLIYINADIDRISVRWTVWWKKEMISGYFRENFIFANSVKRHICDVKHSRPGHSLPLSVNDRVISPFREDFIFTKLRICEVSRK